MSTFQVSPEEFLVRANAQDNGVDPDHMVRLAKAESDLNPDTTPSKKGAVGVMQLMPATALDLGVDRGDSSQNIQGGVVYFRKLLDQFGGDYRKATAAYNAGPARVASGKPLPKETEDYVSKVVKEPEFKVSPEDFLKTTPSATPAPEFSVSPEDFLKTVPRGTDSSTGVAPPPPPASDYDSLISRTKAKYPFIGNVNPVMIPGQRKGGEAWPIGEEGAPDAPRPKQIPLNRHGIEVGPGSTEADIAGEILHVDPFANSIRDKLTISLSPEQTKYLKHESLDYGDDPTMPESLKLRNGVDAAIRGSLVGQWPAEANAGMKYTPYQNGLLDQLRNYMRTGAAPGAAPQASGVPGLERLGGVSPAAGLPPAPPPGLTAPVPPPQSPARVAVPQLPPPQPGAPQILAEEPKVGAAFVSPVAVPAGAMPSKRSQDPGVDVWTENLINAARSGKVGDTLKAAFASPVDMQAVDDQLSNFLVGPFAIQKGVIESAVQAGTSPGNLALMGGIGGAAKIAEAVTSPYVKAAWQTADTALSAYFAGSMATSAAKQGKVAWDAIGRGDYEDAAKQLGFGTVDALFAYMGGKNALANGLDIKQGIQEGIQLGKIKAAMQDELYRREAERRAQERAGMEPKQIAGPPPEAPPTPPAGEIPAPGAPPAQPPPPPEFKVSPEDFLKTPAPQAITPGASFELPSGTYTVRGSDPRSGDILFDQKLPDGTVVPGKFPASAFSRMVRSASPSSPSSPPVSVEAPASVSTETPASVSAAAPGATPLQKEVSLPEPTLPEQKPAQSATEPASQLAASPEKSGDEKQKVEKPAHDYSSTQVNLPTEYADAFNKATAKIPDKDLAEKGREDEPHITVFYGLHTNEPADVQKLISEEGPITAKIGPMSIFPASKQHPDYDVVKMAVESEDLKRLNSKIRELPNGNEFPEYKPHVTVAYVKAGEGKKYAGRSVPGLTGKSVTFDAVHFMPKSGEPSEIPLAAAQSSTAAANPVRQQEPQNLTAETPKQEKTIEPNRTTTPTPPSIKNQASPSQISQGTAVSSSGTDQSGVPERSTGSGRGSGQNAEGVKPPPGAIPSGHWMNHGEIDAAVDKFENHPVLSRATRFLRDFRDETDAHSDGWPYWKLPAHAARQLMTLIQHPEYATEANFKKALAPIRAFYTKRGNAAGMAFPDIQEAKPTDLKEHLAQTGFDKPYSELTPGQKESVDLRAARREAPLPAHEKKPVTPQIVPEKKPGQAGYLLPSFVGKPQGSRVQVRRPDGSTTTGTVKKEGPEGIHVAIDNGAERVFKPSQVTALEPTSGLSNTQVEDLRHATNDAFVAKAKELGLEVEGPSKNQSFLTREPNGKTWLWGAIQRNGRTMVPSAWTPLNISAMRQEREPQRAETSVQPETEKATQNAPPKAIEKPTIEAANNEPASTQPGEGTSERVRPGGSQALEEQLPEGSTGARTSGTTEPGSGEGGALRKPRARAGASQGTELEPGGGTVSGVVGDAARPEQTFPPRATDVVSTRHDRDYRIPDGRVIAGSPDARARTNIQVIKTLRQIEAENRPATVEEQDILARYVGWGAVPQLFEGSNPEFKKLQDELKSLLSDEEFSDARRSTTNAHYTGDLVVDAMWKAVQHFGAAPGMSWLEPAIGVGNFFGRQPQELLEGARRVGLDKEPIAGAIAKLLYPDSGVDVVAFEDAELPKDYFDGAISNVPFGNFGVHDAAFKGKKFLTGSIHNYFFAKALTHVRPGGVVAFVTSRYTMDSYDAPAVSLRSYLREQAHLIGAIRLPSGTFRQNAGTDVITDVIFLRRKLPEEKQLGHSWQKSSPKDIKAEYGSYPIPVNEYYHANPENVLGKEGIGRGQFSQHDYDVKGTATGDQIQAAIEKFPKIGFEPWSPVKRPRTVALRDVTGSEGSKLGGLFFDEKGNLLRKTSKGAAEPVDISDSAKGRIRKQLAIRDALRQLLDAELADKGDVTLKTFRGNLNRLYDSFVKSYGPLSSQANTAAMKGDPDAPLLVSLERKFEKGNKSKGIVPGAEKAPIFSRRMLKPAAVPTSVGEPKEALYISLNEKGRVDWDRMSELTGRTPEQLQQDLKGLVYHDPVTKTWQTAEEYLSGSVRKKLKDASAIAKIEPRYKENVEALEKAQPEDIAPGDIRALLGVTWVPLDTYGEFAADMLGATRPVTMHYAGSEWVVDPGFGNRLNNAPKWSTARASAVDLLNDSLNMRRTRVIDKDSDGNISTNVTEIQAARAKQMEMQEHFEKWLFSDPKRGDALARIYNDTQNDLRLRTYDGSHLTLPGMARDAAVVRGGDLDPHQKAAVWRQIVQPNVLLAHAVGAGKTFEMIAGGMELKRLGLVQRPMYVVPNSTLTSWQHQFSALYPQARVLVFSEKDLEKSARQRVMAQIATGDWDAVVVPHSSFQFLPTGDDIFNEHYEKLANELQTAIDDATEAGVDTRRIKRMEKAKERLLTSLKDKRAAETKDQTVTWEQLGIDHLVVDESHEYKKLGFATKQVNIAGIDSNGNQKTFDLLMKMRHTQSHGRGVVFATGTPVTNTMGELFNLMKYLIEPELEARGMGRFDEWAANFGRTVDVFEPKVEGGGYQMKARFAQFVNIPELAQLLRSFADVVTSDMIDLPRPKIAGGQRQAIETQLTPEQDEYLGELRQRAKSIRSNPAKALPDNMLAIYTDASKMAMDIRMVQPNAPDDPDGRLNSAADKIHQYWKESAKNKGTQLVMSDLGKPAEAGGSPTFSAYDELIKKLVERGIPRNEIAHIYQAKNKSQRSKLFQDINDGKIRVALGSTQKMGVGVNVQQRLYAMHHLDVPHRPSDLEQREGRILRQGNENPEVHLHYYVTKGSLDEAKFSNVVRKAKFINQVMQGKSEVREAEDVGGMIPSLEMFQAMASGDPRVMRKMEVDAEVDRLGNVFSGWKNQQYKIRRDIDQIPYRINGANNRIEVAKRDIATRDKTGPKWSVGKQKFEGDKISKDFNEAISKQVAKVADKQGKDVEIGSAYGLPLLASMQGTSEQGFVRIEVGDIGSITVTSAEMGGGIDFYRRIQNQVTALDDLVPQNERIIEQANQEKKNLEGSIEQVWPYTGKYQGLVAEQQKLVKELGADKGDDAALAAGEGAEIADKSVEAEEPESDEEGEPGDQGAEEEPEQPLGLTQEKRGERGAAPLDFLTLGGAKLVEKDIAPTVRNLASHVAATKDDIARVLAPASRGPMAKQAALTIRERAAELARATDRAEATLELARKVFSKQDTEANLEFMDRIETGQKQTDPHLQGFATLMRDMLDDRRKQVQELGTGKLQTFYEDYFPHIWKKSDDAQKAFKEWFAKRPMEGSKSFLKKRTIPTIKDGIAMGLEPESTNPVDLVLSKIRETDKYLFAHHALNDLKETGVLKFVRATERAPEGFKKIDDNVATVYEGKTEQGSLAIRGAYWAPEPAAEVINNYLSPGLRKYASYRAYMGLGNILNQFQLGWSAYHMGFTSYDSAVSRVALGIMQAARGKPIRGLVTAASFPIAPFRGLWQGDKLLKEWYKPGTQGQEIGELVDAMTMAGGRARMDRLYQTQVTKKMMDALHQGNIWGAAFRLPFALTEQAARPILQWWVPRQKMAVFADLARLEFERLENGEYTPQQFRAALATAWDSVDNRLGQLVYDNLFWNKAHKDIAMGTVRTVGWNLGTIREILGGGADSVEGMGRVLRGKSPEVTTKMAYVLALFGLSALLGGVIYRLTTGENPRELKDYYFPRRGAKGTPGWSKRMSLPSYVKDAVHWVHDPIGTIRGKIHPLLSLLMEEATNKDYFDRPIRNPHDPLVKQLEEMAKHVGTTAEPLAVRPLFNPPAKGPKETTTEKLLPFVGVTEAPKYIKQDMSKAQPRYHAPR